MYYSYHLTDPNTRVLRKLGAIIPASKKAAALMDKWLKTKNGSKQPPLTMETGNPEIGNMVSATACDGTKIIEGTCWRWDPDIGWGYSTCGELKVCGGGGGDDSGDPWPDDNGGNWDSGGDKDDNRGGGGVYGSGGGEDCRQIKLIGPCAEEPKLDPTKPCIGNVIFKPAVAPSGGWNYKGGQFGYTRDSGNSFHDGTDIKADVNSDLFAMHGGTITDIRNSFTPGEYRKNSYGNHIRIKSIINGETVYFRYNHLNSVGVEVGDEVNAGAIIGKTGNTGNAQERNGIAVIPHVHIRARKVVNGQVTKVDPENYMATTFNNDGSVDESESDCNKFQ
jgi:hypothetical protein